MEVLLLFPFTGEGNKQLTETTTHAGGSAGPIWHNDWCTG
jgi:hypothetical protein